MTTAQRLLQRRAARTDELLFRHSLSDFLAIHASIRDKTSRQARDDPYDLNWTTDGCTNAMDYPRGWPFVKACFRHDFAYRNYKDQGRFDKEHKKRADDLFYRE